VKGKAKNVFLFLSTDLIPDQRSLMLRLGSSFFLFGLINNGIIFSVAFSPKILAKLFSSVCDHTVCCSGLGTTIHSEGHYCLLQYRTSLGRQSRMAVHSEGENTICETADRLLFAQCIGHACEFCECVPLTEMK
jgi:hypothetical protein